MWNINWIVYPIGGILCGIVGTIFNKEKSLYKGNMARRGILSHKLRKFFRKANLASNASGAPNCPFHKSGKQGIWRAICENLPLRSGFSGLLRLPPQSPNTQNSSAATPRPGADVGRSFSFKYYSKEVKNKNELVLIVLVKKVYHRTGKSARGSDEILLLNFRRKSLQIIYLQEDANMV